MAPRSFQTLTMDVLCYSDTKKNLPNGKCVESGVLVAGGYSWRISFYPNGNIASTTDAASVSLLLANAAGEDLDVVCQFMIQEFGGGGGPPQFVSSTFTESLRYKKTIGLRLSRFVAHKDLDKSVFAKHDRFTIRCDLAVSPSTSTEAIAGDGAPPPSHLPDPNLSGLPADLGRLLETKKGADVEFEVRGQLFAAHKLVLAARSSVLNEEFFGSMMEKDTSYISISDMDPKAFKALLRYIYTDTLPEIPLNSREEGVVVAEGLLLATDRYNLKDLKALIEKMMCEHVRVSTVLPMLALAEQHQCLKLKEKCLRFMTFYWNARETMKTGDFEHLARSCPSVIKEVINKILDGREEERKGSFISNLVFSVFFMALMVFLMCF
ncbi:hypothetical protein QOZ80_7AG0554940 [Eleusine coracana subsp. coracana]|nr:hypothetical protein QOZ80_7AG0554940 [Eleusine coracana subsp. coracana]